jgi:hypothetical protein
MVMVIIFRVVIICLRSRVRACICGGMLNIVVVLRGILCRVLLVLNFLRVSVMREG